MKNLSIPAFTILIAIAFIAQPVAVSMAQNGNLLTAMRGHHLFDAWGEDLGKIECVTPYGTGQPFSIVISVDDNKIVTIPFSELLSNSEWDLDYLVVNIPRDRLRNLPSINEAQVLCRLSP